MTVQSYMCIFCSSVPMKKSSYYYRCGVVVAVVVQKLLCSSLLKHYESINMTHGILDHRDLINIMHLLIFMPRFTFSNLFLLFM